MEDKILFIVFNGEIKFLKDASIDHREWYLSLGGNIEEYPNVIRGYITEGKLIFFKEDLKYDSEVIDFATKMAIPMKKQLNQPDLKVCCGINPGHDGVKWEPILVLKDQDLDGYEAPAEGVPELSEDIILKRAEAKADEEIERIQKEVQTTPPAQAAEQIPVEPVIEFKNDMQDEKFTKYALKFTVILLIVAAIVKIILINNKTMPTSNRWNMLLILVQIGGLIVSIVGYSQKMTKTKYFSLAASVASIFMFDLVDIIIGVLNLLFTIDQNYVVQIIDFLKNATKKGAELSKKGAAMAKEKTQKKK